MSEILKESERYKEMAQPEVQTKEETEQPAQELPTSQTQIENIPIPQSNNAILLQNNNIVKPKKRKTDEREKKMYYLDPGQSDKLDDLRREYKQRTGKKLNEQDFMRYIINHLTIDMLL